MTVPSVKKGEAYTKSYVVRIERENGKINEIQVDDGFYKVRFVFIRDSNGKVQAVEYYEKVE
ncbi:MAG: hypothetical protein J7J51_05220 [Candidatus Omnitrophica bacterium]|nr:hypothetical protein [Candidatus Omnitrophota bacterium]